MARRRRVRRARACTRTSRPYEGVDRPGYVYPGAEALAARWVERMGCGEDGEVGLRDEMRRSRATRRPPHLEACEEGGRVALWTLEGASHVPSIDAEAPPKTPALLALARDEFAPEKKPWRARCCSAPRAYASGCAVAEGVDVEADADAADAAVVAPDTAGTDAG